jgi:hypothetical protein
MAGSKRWFQYTLDDGTNVAVQLDESNTEAVNGAVANIPASPPTRQAPKGTKLRTITYASADGLRKIRCVALNNTIYGAIPASLGSIPNPLPAAGGGGGTLFFDSKQPERVRSPKFRSDTGLNDGDSPA